MKKEELRVIPVKNYIILGVIILVSFLLIYYLYMWSQVYNESKLNKPILDRYMEVINYNELNDYLIENPDTIIYVSVLENNDIREFEKKFKNVLRRGEVDKEVLYMDITEDIKNKNARNEMNDIYAINSVSMIDVPVIMVIDDGALKSIYSIRDNGYDIDRLKVFINNVRFSSEDPVNG